MPTVDQAWAALYGPVQHLKQYAGTETWEANRTRFLREVDGNDPSVVELVRRLDELPDAERAGLMAGDTLDSFAYQVIQETAEPNHPDGDDAAWAQFLTTNVPAWDGSAESWAAFRAWFAYHAAEAFADRATAFLDYLEPLAASERVTALAHHYGIVIARPATEASSSSSSSSSSADLGPAWTALVSRAPARWDGQAASWPQFRTALLAAAIAAGVEQKALEFLGEAESRESDVSRFNYLRAFDLTSNPDAAPDNLDDYTPTLYRLSGLRPHEVITAAGWGDNVYTAIFPATVTPTTDEIKTLLTMASQQGMGGFLYRFPLAAASIRSFRYMNTALTIIQQAIPAWLPTMRLVEVICADTPDRDQIEVSVGGSWRPISALVRR